MPKCEDCKYLFIGERQRDQQTGGVDMSVPPEMACRRYPPQAAILMGPQGPVGISQWPIVQGDQSCGEFQPANPDSIEFESDSGPGLRVV